ncbi:MAG TPA: hypothetical protein EYP63_04165 [Desulfotomaculum sp.]|nr:hypothetical protein [Desulfotomaculum sp.]
MAVEGVKPADRVLVDKIERLSVAMEKMRLAEYVRLLENPWRLMYINLIAGIARGVGIAIGFTILGAAVAYLLRNLVAANLPGIGKFIAEVVRMVELHLY